MTVECLLRAALTDISGKKIEGAIALVNKPSDFSSLGFEWTSITEPAGKQCVILQAA